jgi:hypothetical protein
MAMSTRRNTVRSLTALTHHIGVILKLAPDTWNQDALYLDTGDHAARAAYLARVAGSLER